MYREWGIVFIVRFIVMMFSHLESFYRIKDHLLDFRDFVIECLAMNLDCHLKVINC